MRWLPEMPLLRREVVGLLRAPRAFWLLVAVVAVSSLVPLAFHSSFRGLPPAQSNRFFFAIFLSIQLAVVLLVVPAFTSGAVAGERESGTLELLHMTLLRPSSIAFAKVGAAIIFVLLLILGCAPLTCITYVLGGIEFATIASCYAVVAAATVSSAIAAVWEEHGPGGPDRWSVCGGSLLVSLVGIAVFWGVAAVRSGERFFARVVHAGHPARPSPSPRGGPRPRRSPTGSGTRKAP